MKKSTIKLTNKDNIEIDEVGIFKGVFNILKNTVGQQFTSLPTDAVDTITSIKLTDTHGSIAWKLISRSLVNTLVQLVSEKLPYLEEVDIETYEIDKELNELLNSNIYEIDNNFFKSPQDHLFIAESKEIIKSFLELFELEEYEVNNILDRFNTYFIFSLIEEYKTNISIYQQVEDALITPFNDIEDKFIEWFRYKEWIKKQIEEPIFGESFGLKQVYIPLKAYCKKESEIAGRDDISIIVDLEEELLEWVQTGDKDDAIKLLRGGPGYGKSSFFKVFASKLVEQNYNVLFIPLHHINIENDMKKSIINFLKNSGLLNIDPFETEKIIIIFDGLDELSMQGKTISESANSFVREIQRQITTFNATKLQLQVLISGRDIIIQENESEFRNERQIYRLLPYYVNRYEKDKLGKFQDTRNLLMLDQRNDWWTKYGKLKNGKYKGLPKELNNRDLDEITSQPLLNYLIALSYERGEVDFKNETNLNIIYEDLLIGVYKRAYDGKNNTHRSLSRISLKDFKRLLEEIGISTWHGDGRKTTVKEIHTHFKTGGLSKLMDKFTKDAEKGVISLLAAFYFKKSGENNLGDETFEFTHKSFGEFLTAKRIIATIKHVHSRFIQYEESEYSEDGWDTKESLSKWLNVFAKKEIDVDLHKFIENEIQLLANEHKELLKAYQKTLAGFINYLLENGLPIEKMDPRPNTFLEENKLSLNAEKSLLILHGTIAKYTGEISGIKTKASHIFGSWISRLMGQRLTEREFTLQFLNNLDLTHNDLYLKDLRSAILNKTKLNSAWLYQANLQHAQLFKSSFIRAHLMDANFIEANLSKANLQNADFNGANLRGADFYGTDLSNVNFRNTDLREVNFQGAKFNTKTNFIGAKMNNAKLQRNVLETIKLNKRQLNQIEIIES